MLESATGSIPVIDELYDLIGGSKTVRAATELFYKKVFADELLRPFFETTDKAQLVARQSMFVSMLLGGRVVYTGKDIAEVHASSRRQGLNDGHFDRFVRHFREALLEIGVSSAKTDRVMQHLERKRSTVLNPAKQQSA